METTRRCEGVCPRCRAIWRHWVWRRVELCAETLHCIETGARRKKHAKGPALPCAIALDALENQHY